MAKMHSYSVENQDFRLRIIGFIALLTFIFVLLVGSFKSGRFNLESFMIYLPSSFGTLTVFAIVHKIYDYFFWKLNKLDKIPNLSGTWIGIAYHLYAESSRLEVMYIKQHWTKMCITVDVYKKDSYQQDWLNADLLGTECSTSAHITEDQHRGCDLTFNYNHSGEMQDSFKGTMFLKYKNNNELNGKFFHTKKGQFLNTKTSYKENYEGVVGEIVLWRVAAKFIELEEALQKVNNGNMLSKFENTVKSRIKRMS
jgi:SMODS-associating 2TM, beta-strand rich effector domain